MNVYTGRSTKRLETELADLLVRVEDLEWDEAYLAAADVADAAKDLEFELTRRAQARAAQKR